MLRSATAEYHLRLEQSLPLMSPRLTIGDYAALVDRFYGFVEPLEAVLWDIPGLAAIGMHKAERGKVHLLVNDLGAMGRAPGTLKDLPRVQCLPQLDNISDALGVLYVMEGSTLGGQVIRRRLEQTLGIGTTTGAAYFASYGSAAGAHWREYLNVLSESESYSDASRVVAAAVDTFAILQQWLVGHRIPDQ